MIDNNPILDFLDIVTPVVSAIISAIIGWFVGRRQRKAKTDEIQIRSEKVLAEAVETYADIDNKELSQLGKVIEAWQELFNATNEKLVQLQKQQTKSDIAMSAIVIKLEEYKKGVAILIKQLKNLGIKPKWQPNDLESKEVRK